LSPKPLRAFALIAGEPPALPVFASLIQIKFAF